MNGDLLWADGSALAESIKTVEPIDAKVAAVLLREARYLMSRE